MEKTLTDFDDYRVNIALTQGLDTIIKSEMLDVDVFLGHRAALLDGSDNKTFTKLEGVCYSEQHVESAIKKMVTVFETIGENSWLEGEIVFKDEQPSPIKVGSQQILDKDSTVIEKCENMMRFGWGYTDVVSAGVKDMPFRKFSFTRDDWHGKSLPTPVILHFVAPLHNYNSEVFVENVDKLAKKAIMTWSSMIDAVPTQNGFGEVIVNRLQTEQLFTVA